MGLIKNHYGKIGSAGILSQLPLQYESEMLLWHNGILPILRVAELYIM